MSSTPGVTVAFFASGIAASASPSGNGSTRIGSADVFASMNRSSPGVVSNQFHAIGGSSFTSFDNGVRS